LTEELSLSVILFENPFILVGEEGMGGRYHSFADIALQIKILGFGSKADY
jgi:hypothetical protein